MEKEQPKSKHCTGVCRFMIPALLVLLLLFSAYYLVEEAKGRYEKTFVVLTQRGEEVLRVPLRDSSMETREIPIVHKGEDLKLSLEIRGKSARILSKYKTRYSMESLSESTWIHDKEDVFLYEPYELKLYFE
ncbi:hypothetical protein [Proteiniclasticum ruminis]|uniref:hypothetical protein n=1 Tax=Proteiniclasticum ruminis TaxID=398199 RepID=UPI0028AB0E59|nr:hypothetical protein [Proteiniclasticum ruminis]